MEYVAYLAICIATTVSPGPAVLTAIKNGSLYGVSRALIGILGNVMAIVTLALASGIGLGALILSSATLFMVMKIAGGIYLIYLGCKSWRAKPWNVDIQADSVRSKELTSLQLFKESFFVGISNPKAIVFYTALFPQFIDLNASYFTQVILLTSIFAICSFSFLALYASMSSKLSKHLKNENVLSWFNRVSGGIFVGFGLTLVTNSKP